MGLLDDAIREHLELKRLRGADPGAVAQEEHEALGPVQRGSGTFEGKRQDDLTSSQAGEGLFSGDYVHPTTGDLSTVGQETAEIDMDTVLEPDRGTEHAPKASGGQLTAPAHPAPARPAADDSLEWEVPGERVEEHATHPDGHDEHPGSGDRVDDVLEETPDFLRDTPEQERLWFEQRPPRDFDFNE